LRDCQIAGNSFRAFATASMLKSVAVHQGNDLGYGNNAKDWTIRSQVLRALGSMDAVQRLDGSRFRVLDSRLKIESGPPEMEP
jgi:hypothetical protein